MVTAIDLWGTVKTFRQSSRSRPSSHSTYPGPARNKTRNRTKNANSVKRLFFLFFISCLTERFRHDHIKGANFVKVRSQIQKFGFGEAQLDDANWKKRIH